MKPLFRSASRTDRLPSPTAAFFYKEIHNRKSPLELSALDATINLSEEKDENVLVDVPRRKWRIQHGGKGNGNAKKRDQRNNQPAGNSAHATIEPPVPATNGEQGGVVGEVGWGLEEEGGEN